MAGSDAGDDEDDSAMATVATEKVDSDEDSDRGSDHSGLKRKSLAMKVSVGCGQQGGQAGDTVELSLDPPQQNVVEKTTLSGFPSGKWGPVWFWGSDSCLMMPVGWWDGQSWWGLQPGGGSRAAALAGLVGKIWRKPFLGSNCFPQWVEKEWSSLTLSPLLCQMPVTKRPRKSSSDLDQGSPSVTEEENSETSSESEKNSDQVRGWREPDRLDTMVTLFYISSCFCFPPGFHS